MTPPILYSYDPMTGIYAGTVEPRPDPRVPGAWLVPAFTTVAAPPSLGPHRVARWTGEAWEVVADYRNVTWWHPVTGVATTITELGERPPKGAAFEPPPPTLEQLACRCRTRWRSQSDQALDALRDAYPSAERETWPQQLAEARALLADPAAATPILTAIATARGTTAAALAGKVIEHADAWTARAGTVIGRRQALEDQLHTLLHDRSQSAAQKRAALEAWLAGDSNPF